MRSSARCSCALASSSVTLPVGSCGEQRFGGGGVEPVDGVAADGVGEELGVFGDLGDGAAGTGDDEFDPESHHQQGGDGRTAWCG